MAQLAWPNSTATLPPGLDIQWIGTTGFRLAYQGTVVWIDPYLTRIPFGAFLARRVRPSDDAILAHHVDRADAVLVGHTHFDHAMDAAPIAARTGCKVYGSTSMTHLMQLHGLAAQGVTVEAYTEYAIGPFVVTFVPSVHSKLILGLGTPSNGELTCDHLDHLSPQAYHCGQVWGIPIAVAGITLYHQASRDLVQGAMAHPGMH